MTILEQCTIGKAGQEKCEDAVVVNDRFAAVIDGSTSKSHQRFNPDMSNGRLCMTLVRQLLNTMPADTPSERFCQDITANVRAVYLQAAADMEQLTNHPTERMAASAAIYSPARREVWLVGDCQCLVDEQFYDNPKPYEEPVAEMRAAYIRLQLMQGRPTSDFQKHDEGRDFVLPVLIDSCRYQNKTFSVIDGFSIPASKIRIIDVSQAREIVLATDGYPFLRSTLAESEHELAQLLAEDPLCIHRFKATKGLMQGNKSFDDRSYLRLLTQ
jgi:glycerophosphoryl diester phosphodiesterase